MDFPAYHVQGMYLLVEDVWRHLEQLNNNIKTYILLHVKYFNNNLTKYLKIYHKYMQNTFLEKKNKLLEALRMLALKHNRDYYVSIIPFVEQLVEEQEDILDMYSYALYENAQTLFQSRQALMAHHLVEFLL
jgi:predicted MPP superfamily phosphohydrolase